MRPVFTALIVAALCLTTFPVLAQVSPDSTSTFTPPSWSLSPWGSVGRMLVVLAFVVALIWITLAVLKRAMGFKGGAASGVKLMGGVSLGQRKSLQFVQVGKALLLLGATDNSINLIATIHDPDEIKNIVARGSESGGDPFGSILKKLTGKSTAAGNAGA